MAILTLTLKLPFHRLNTVKAVEFERLTAINPAPYTSKSDHRNGMIGKRVSIGLLGLLGIAAMQIGMRLKTLVNGLGLLVLWI